jgi:hypothetical protein
MDLVGLTREARKIFKSTILGKLQQGLLIKYIPGAY